MSGPAPGGFPWGDNRPTVPQRVTVSIAIAAVSAVLHYYRAAEWGGRSDFAPLWHAARLALAGQDPYQLIGPGKAVESVYNMYYPGTAFVFALPFSLIPSFHLASTVFVFVSAMLLAYGVTADGWHRLPIFPSIAYCTTVFIAQWSIIMTAALFLPAVAMIAASKPQSSIPAIASSTNPRTYQWAAGGTIALIAASLWLLPSWPASWLGMVRGSSDFVPAVSRFAGPAILLALFRWRRPEAWLILIAACLPQTWPPYNGLILMTVAATYREACFLSLVSSFSWAGWAWFFGEGLTPEQSQSQMSTVLNLSSYLPATLLVLLRPNQGTGPLWLSWLVGLRRQGPGGRGVQSSVPRKEA